MSTTKATTELMPRMVDQETSMNEATVAPPVQAPFNPAKFDPSSIMKAIQQQEDEQDQTVILQEEMQPNASTADSVADDGHDDQDDQADFASILMDLAGGPGNLHLLPSWGPGLVVRPSPSSSTAEQPRHAKYQRV